MSCHHRVHSLAVSLLMTPPRPSRHLCIVFLPAHRHLAAWPAIFLTSLVSRSWLLGPAWAAGRALRWRSRLRLSKRRWTCCLFGSQLPTEASLAHFAGIWVVAACSRQPESPGWARSFRRGSNPHSLRHHRRSLSPCWKSRVGTMTF